MKPKIWKAAGTLVVGTGGVVGVTAHNHHEVTNTATLDSNLSHSEAINWDTINLADVIRIGAQDNPTTAILFYYMKDGMHLYWNDTGDDNTLDEIGLVDHLPQWIRDANPRNAIAENMFQIERDQGGNIVVYKWNGLTAYDHLPTEELAQSSVFLNHVYVHIFDADHHDAYVPFKVKIEKGQAPT